MTESPCPGSSGTGRTGEAAVLKAENAAIEMYRYAALMLGDEAEALSLVESTVAEVDIDPCADPCATKGLVRQRVIDGALALMLRHDPASFASASAASPSSSCIEDDDDWAPLSGEQVSELVSGAGRSRLLDWLNHLSRAQRAIFVQRALLGQSNAATAQAINRMARPSIWTPEAVATLFRQTLCSLATSLLHAVPAARA